MLKVITFDQQVQIITTLDGDLSSDGLVLCVRVAFYILGWE
jgi:hypothetical protein